MRSEAWRPAAAARTRSPREARDPARQALRPGCEELAVTDPMPAEASAEAGAGERSAAPRPKTATVERRPAVAKAMAGYSPARRRQGYGGLLTRRSFSEGGEASVPRHKRVHARLDALWDARRLARRLACCVMCRPNGCRCTRTFLGAPPTSRVKLLTLLQVPIWLRCKTYTSTYF